MPASDADAEPPGPTPAGGGPDVGRTRAFPASQASAQPEGPDAAGVGRTRAFPAAAARRTRRPVLALALLGLGVLGAGIAALATRSGTPEPSPEPVASPAMDGTRLLVPELPATGGAAQGPTATPWPEPSAVLEAETPQATPTTGGTLTARRSPSPVPTSRAAPTPRATPTPGAGTPAPSAAAPRPGTLQVSWTPWGNATLDGRSIETQSNGFRQLPVDEGSHLLRVECPPAGGAVKEWTFSTDGGHTKLGCWDIDFWWSRAATRWGSTPTYRCNYIGFRLARSMP